MTSTYWTLIDAVALDNEPEPEKLCVCELLLPAELDITVLGVAEAPPTLSEVEPHAFEEPVGIPWLWLANCAVVSVVEPTEPLMLTEPETDGVPNAVVNAELPPELAVPDTTRNALLSCEVDFVQPVGAAVCTNSMTVEAGMPELAAVVCVVPSLKVMVVPLTVIAMIAP